MAQDLAKFVTLLEQFLQLGALKNFMPFFELVGSMAEGTRIGLANELDLGLKFKSWLSNVPFKVEGDPFSLKKADNSPSFMDEFFEGDQFQFHKFMGYLLNAIEKAVTEIFHMKLNPPRLRCVTTNQQWYYGKTPCNGECKKYLERRDFEQCDKCIVTVSQTKSGIALQFNWIAEEDGMKRVYCSIDLIPVFQITPMPTIRLTRLIVENMLSDDAPPGWLNFLFKYWKDYKIILELALAGGGNIKSVDLKTMTFHEGRNHHIKPAQEFTEAKFSSERMRDIYSYIKFLKKVLNLDLSSYWVKKELQAEGYQKILDSCVKGVRQYRADKDDVALVKILSEPEFRAKIPTIDFVESRRRSYIVAEKKITEVQIQGATQNGSNENDTARVTRFVVAVVVVMLIFALWPVLLKIL